ncbi:MAG TPA: hypothetical protein VNK95_01130 [Caldilineaceae bacterium]|nr:hypothetical protein [Caldilineaceae bacterium]
MMATLVITFWLAALLVTFWLDDPALERAGERPNALPNREPRRRTD